MTELKTLKDIKHERKELSEDWVWKNDLKAEAIKWVKNFDNLKVEVKQESRIGKVNNLCMESRKNVLMEFFNLTEEDLK